MWFLLRKRKQTKTNLEANPINVILDEEKELLGDPEDARWLVPREKPAVPLVPEIIKSEIFSLCQDFIVLCLIGDIFSPNDPLWQIISDIIIERVGKCLGTSVEVLVRSTLKKRLNHCVF